jgi:hypothetical protein
LLAGINNFGIAVEVAANATVHGGLSVDANLAAALRDCGIAKRVASGQLIWTFDERVVSRLFRVGPHEDLLKLRSDIDEWASSNQKTYVEVATSVVSITLYSPMKVSVEIGARERPPTKKSIAKRPAAAKASANGQSKNDRAEPKSFGSVLIGMYFPHLISSP